MVQSEAFFALFLAVVDFIRSGSDSGGVLIEFRTKIQVLTGLLQNGVLKERNKYPRVRLDKSIFQINSNFNSLTSTPVYNCFRECDTLVRCPTIWSGQDMALRSSTLFHHVTVNWDSGRKLEH